MEGFRKCNGKEHLFWPPQHAGVVMSAACNTAVLTKTVHTGVQTPVRSSFSITTDTHQVKIITTTLQLHYCCW